MHGARYGTVEPRLRKESWELLKKLGALRGPSRCRVALYLHTIHYLVAKFVEVEVTSDLACLKATENCLELHVVDRRNQDRQKALTLKPRAAELAHAKGTRVVCFRDQRNNAC